MSQTRSVAVIRKANQGDCLNLAVLSTQVWLHTYAQNGIRTGISQFVMDNFNSSAFEKILADDDFDILVCERGPFILGFAIVNHAARFEDDSNGFEIDKFYVQEHCYGQGIGRMLLQGIMEHFGPNFWLTTWIHNERAIGFYRHIGFRDIGQAWFEFEGQHHENRVFAYKAESDSAKKQPENQ